jgi:DNA polymerase epsilon subunit 1
MPLELDTDGIWACLPKTFPENFQFKTKSGKKLNFDFPCTMCNNLVYEKYGNNQY